MGEHRCENERGAVFLVSAIAFAAMLVIVALVVDLGAVKVNRSEGQIVTDSAATAAIVALVGGDGQAACDAAFGYAGIHTGTLSGASCSGFSSVCDASTPQAQAIGTRDGITVTVTHPVDDTDPLMSPGAIGSPAQALILGDGDRCERVGVRLDDEHDNMFGGLVGVGTTTTTNHTVALISDEYGRNLIVNMLLLEREECEVLTLGGGGSTGGVSVSAVTDPDTGDVFPGRIAMDSDGSICGSEGVISTNGSGAAIVAYGPAGCADELAPVADPAGPGRGCGRIETYAEGSPGCNMPACSSSGLIGPSPTRVTRRLTRAPVDWRYNCQASYPASYDIGGCRDAGTTPGYIQQLIDVDGQIGGSYRSYMGEGYDCHVKNPLVMPAGNWKVECPTLRLQDPLTFSGGNVVFYEDVIIQSELHVNPGGVLDEVVVYMRDGRMSNSSSSIATFENTVMYVSPTAEVDLGSGETSWSAPLTGPFEDLALWSDSTAEQHFSGGASIALDGIFFTPLATIVYTGSGGQDSVEAQFIANKMRLQGNGNLHIQPKYTRSQRYPPPNISELIR